MRKDLRGKPSLDKIGCLLAVYRVDSEAEQDIGVNYFFGPFHRRSIERLLPAGFPALAIITEKGFYRTYFKELRLEIFQSVVEILPELPFFVLPVGAETGVEKIPQFFEEAFPAGKLFVTEDILQEGDDLSHFLLG
jgi:hypothetical protein